MDNTSRRRRIVRTNFIEFNSGKCEACWECITACSSGVLGKINLFFHKHAHIINGDACKGCLKCVKICAHGALTRIK